MNVIRGLTKRAPDGRVESPAPHEAVSPTLPSAPSAPQALPRSIRFTEPSQAPRMPSRADPAIRRSTSEQNVRGARSEKPRLHVRTDVEDERRRRPRRPRHERHADAEYIDSAPPTTRRPKGVASPEADEQRRPSLPSVLAPSAQTWTRSTPADPIWSRKHRYARAAEAATGASPSDFAPAREADSLWSEAVPPNEPSPPASPVTAATKAAGSTARSPLLAAVPFRPLGSAANRPKERRDKTRKSGKQRILQQAREVPSDLATLATLAVGHDDAIEEQTQRERDEQWLSEERERHAAYQASQLAKLQATPPRQPRRRAFYTPAQFEEEEDDLFVDVDDGDLPPLPERFGTPESEAETDSDEFHMAHTGMSTRGAPPRTSKAMPPLPDVSQNEREQMIIQEEQERERRLLERDAQIRAQRAQRERERKERLEREAAAERERKEAEERKKAEEHARREAARAELVRQQQEIAERKRRILRERKEREEQERKEREAREAEERKAREAREAKERKEREAREAEAARLLAVQEATEAKVRAAQEAEAAARAQREAEERARDEEAAEAARIKAERVRIETEMRLEQERVETAKREAAAKAEREAAEREAARLAEAARLERENREAEAARAKEQARREREEKEKEARRLAQLEAEKAAREKAESERVARLEAAALAEAARQERLARATKEEQERKERLAKEEQERKERLAKEEQERKERALKVEQERKERLAREEQERKERFAKEEQARRERIVREERERKERLAREEREKKERIERMRRIERERKEAEERAAKEAAARAAAEREHLEQQRVQIEEKALKRAKREAEDEDRVSRARGRRQEELSVDDDAESSIAASDATSTNADDAESETNLSELVTKKLQVVSKSATSGLQGILARADEKEGGIGPSLRFADPDPLRVSDSQGVRPHPELPWFNAVIDEGVPRTGPVETPVSAESAMSYLARSSVHGIYGVLRSAADAVQSAGSLDHSVAGDEDWMVRPAGPYRDGAVKYFPGFCIHGLADTEKFVEAPTGESDGERVFAASPYIVDAIVAALDFGDIRRLAETSRSLRRTLTGGAALTVVLERFLGPAGYVAWPDAADPLPLTLYDCEAFLLCSILKDEYRAVGQAYLAEGHRLDRRIPRLARTSLRAYSKVLARVRMAPDASTPTGRAPAWDGVLTLPTPQGLRRVAIQRPYTPGRVSLFKVWAPEDKSTSEVYSTELQRTERELFIAGIWRFLHRGDMALNVAKVDQYNDGRYIFNGEGFVPLASKHDPIGHLPSFLNLLLYPPTYYHGVVRYSGNSPVLYLDLLPWRAEIVHSMQLVRDNVETLGANGQLYRVSKWLYRAALTIDVPPSDAAEYEESPYDAHHGWNGTLVLEAEGTSEHARGILRRCVAPREPDSLLAAMLDSVMAGANATIDVPAVQPYEEGGAPPTYPWVILRERSRAGMIWLSLL